MSNGRDRFQGEVKSTLKSIERRLDKHDRHFERIYEQIAKNQLTIERIKVKLGIIAGGIGIVTGVAWNYIQKMKLW